MADAANSRKAALGFRTHSGWAAAILATGGGSAIQILDRRHVVLCDSAKEGSKQPFHAAEPMPLALAQSHVGLCRKATEELARNALCVARNLCAQRSVRLCGVCVITASGRTLPDFAAILASHALIHAAEGEFYRGALLATAQAHNLKATRLKAAEALSQIANQTDMNEAAVTRKLTALGKTVGRPWTSDEKLATLAAWSLLAR